MEQKAKVLKVVGEEATILVIRKTACNADCDKCGGGCGKDTPLVASAKNKMGAKVGDFVMVYSENKGVLKKAFILYLLPFIMFFALYILGDSMKMQGSACAMLGIAGFVGTFVGVIFYDRHIAKENEMPVIIKILN